MTDSTGNPDSQQDREFIRLQALDYAFKGDWKNYETSAVLERASQIEEFIRTGGVPLDTEGNTD